MRVHATGPRGWAFLSVLAVACGCGGGGGPGGGGGTQQPPSGDPVALTSANAADAGGDVLGSTFDLAVGSLSFDVPGKFGDLGGSWGLALATRDAVRRAHDAGRAGVALHDDDSESCADGGTVFVTHVDADSSGTTTTGDAYDYTFAGCAFAEVVVGGTIHLAVTTLVGRFEDAEYSLVSAVTANLSVSSMGQTFAIAGTFTATVSETSDTLTVDISTLGLAFQGADGSVVLSAQVHYDEDFLGNYTFSTDGGLVSQELGGSVTWSTVQAFTGASGEWPSQGQLVIFGADESTVTVVVVSGTTVRFDVDSNGDGAIDDSFERPWNSIAD